MTEVETKLQHIFWVSETKKDACSLTHIKPLFPREGKYTVPISPFWNIFSHQMKLRMKILYMYVEIYMFS